MALRIGNISIDCHDVSLVAHFWSAAIGRPLDAYLDDGFGSIGGGDASRTEPAWYFERVPEGKSAKNRVHLDFVDPEPGVVERLVALGATMVDEHELAGMGHRWTVMRDPEGNEFCVAAKSFVGP